MPDKHRLEQTIAALQMRFGARAVRRLGEGAYPPVDRLTTGFSALDDALDGGLPRGRIVEIAGAPTAGLATLALKVVAQVQAQGENAVYLDLEQTFDPDYAARCGVMLDRLVLVRPYDARQAFALLRDFAGGERGVLVCDLPPGVVADTHLVQALSTTLGRLLLPLGRSATVLLCLVSLPPSWLPSSKKLPLQHYTAVRLLLQRKCWLHSGDDICGYRANIFVAKNKLGAAGQSLAVDITFDGVVQGDGTPGSRP